jgi:hypothetical protein
MQNYENFSNVLMVFINQKNRPFPIIEKDLFKLLKTFMLVLK